MLKKLTAFILLVSYTTSYTAQSMHRAIASADMNAIQRMLDADPTRLEERHDWDGSTPLLMAVQQKNRVLHNTCYIVGQTVIQLMLTIETLYTL